MSFVCERCKQKADDGAVVIVRYDMHTHYDADLCVACAWGLKDWLNNKEWDK